MCKLIASDACLNNPINPAHIPFHKNYLISGIFVWGYNDNDNHFIPVYIGSAGGKSPKIFGGIFSTAAGVRGGWYEIPDWLQRRCGHAGAITYLPNDLNNFLEFNNTPTHTAKLTIEYIICNFRFIYLQIKDQYTDPAKRYVANRIGRERILNKPDRYANNLPDEIEEEIDRVFGFCYNPPV